MASMTALTALLLAATAVPPGRPAPAITAPPQPVPAVRLLGSAADVAALCRALTPVERLRAAGDALERGEAEAKHEVGREAAVRGRYEVMVPAAKLAFAPYDGPERRLALAEPAILTVLGAMLWPSDERDLAVTAEAPVARRILDAQRAGRLALRLAFDLPDEATCGAGVPGASAVLPVEPVDWAWLDAGVVLARGGAGADRPILSASHGARPTVEVGDPIAGPTEAKRLVLTRAADLEGCYARALEKDPAVDGVLVVEMGAARLAVAADSTGSPELGACVQKVLGTLPALGGAGKAAVPIRFGLVAPGAPAAVPATAPAPTR
jgi:hypothetical protein